MPGLCEGKQAPGTAGQANLGGVRWIPCCPGVGIKDCLVRFDKNRYFVDACAVGGHTSAGLNPGGMIATSRPPGVRRFATARKWAKRGDQAAIFETVSLPSRTAARVTATRCAPSGDYRMRRRLPIRVFPMSSTHSLLRAMTRLRARFDIGEHNLRARQSCWKGRNRGLGPEL